MSGTTCIKGFFQVPGEDPVPLDEHDHLVPLADSVPNLGAAKRIAPDDQVDAEEGTV